jgi:hypothetical protein
MSSNSFDSLNNLDDLSFVAGTDKTLTFSVYEEDGVTPLNINSGSALWRICLYGEFKTTIFEKAGSVSGTTITVGLTSSDTLSINSSNIPKKFIQQIIVTDNDGKVFIPGQGSVIISPSISS